MLKTIIKILFLIYLLSSSNCFTKEIQPVRILCKYSTKITKESSSWENEITEYLNDQTSIYIIKDSIFFEENGRFFKNHYETYNLKEKQSSRYGHLYINKQRIYASDEGEDLNKLKSNSNDQKKHTFSYVIEIDRITGKYLQKVIRKTEWDDKHHFNEEHFSWGNCEIAKNKF
jgi:hypothetical protein